MTALRTVIDAYRAALPAGDTAAFAVDPLDRVGVSVRIVPFRTPDGLQFDGFGYGTTPNEALVGALGEVSESVHCETWMRACPRETASFAVMRDAHGERHVADPLTLCLPAGSAYTPDTALTWVPGVRVVTGETVWLPAEFAAVHRGQMRGADPLITPITNGLGAGLSRDQALAHGLLELLQRDGNTVSFRALDRGRVVDVSSGLEPETAALVDRLRGLGLDVTVKLAGTEFGTVSVYVVGDEHGEPRFPMMLTACGEAAHPHAGTAVRKAVLEYAAARSRKCFMHGPLEQVRGVAPPGYLDAYLAKLDVTKEEPRCLDAMAGWLTKSAADLRGMLAGSVFSERERVAFASLPTVPRDAVADPRDRCKLVLDRLTAAGCDVFALDFSPDAGRAGVFAVKAVVAGVECETMSYYRVGERGVRRLSERGDDFVGLGDRPAGALSVRLTADAEARLGGPAWLDPARVNALVGPLYPLYREPNSHAAPVRLAQLLAR